MHDPLSLLRESGIPVDQLSDAQREVLASLTDQEAEVLVSVQLRLQQAAGEVEAHEMKLL